MSNTKSTGAGKGDKLRPVNKKVYDENFDAIDWNPKPKLEVRVKINKNTTGFLDMDVTELGGVCYDGSRGLNWKYNPTLHTLPPLSEEEPTWDAGSSVIDPGGPVCDGARKFLDEKRNNP